MAATSAPAREVCAGCHDEDSSVVSGVSAPNVVGDEDGAYAYGTAGDTTRRATALRGGLPRFAGAGANLKCTACTIRRPRTSTGTSGRTASPGQLPGGYRLKRRWTFRGPTRARPCRISRCASTARVEPVPRVLGHDDELPERTTVNSHWLHLQAPPTGQFAGGGWWDSDWTARATPSSAVPPATTSTARLPPGCFAAGADQHPGNDGQGAGDQLPVRPVLPDAVSDACRQHRGTAQSLHGRRGLRRQHRICIMCHANNIGYTRNRPTCPADQGRLRQRGEQPTRGRLHGGRLHEPGRVRRAGFGGLRIHGRRQRPDGHRRDPRRGGSDRDRRTLLRARLLERHRHRRPRGGHRRIDLRHRRQAMERPPSSFRATRRLLPSRTGARRRSNRIGIQSNVALSLLDGESGVDWTTFSITLSGDKGYSGTYTDLDTSIVSRTGTPAGYSVTVNPNVDFSYGEMITVHGRRERPGRQRDAAVRLVVHDGFRRDAADDDAASSGVSFRVRSP